MVQYLPVTGELVPLHILLNRTTTGCTDANRSTGTFVQTHATTIQATITQELVYDLTLEHG